MKTAVIYARYSCSNQTEQSIEGQLDVCNKFAESNDLQIVKVYADRAMTGTNDNRPDFQQMLKDSERANWDVVLVYAIDRFGRNAIEVAVNKQKLKKNGKILISATQRTSENLDGTKNLDGIILENVYIGIAEYYSAELSQKVRRGMNESRHKGNFTGGFLIYGFEVKNHKIFINEEEADVVRYIYDQYLHGVFVKDIVKKLTEKGIYHNGKAFAKNTVYNILKNEKYSGIYRYNDEVFDNIYPRIVPKDLFESVQKKIVANRYGGRSPHVVYLLHNKLKCGYCGSLITAETGTAKNGEVIRYYKCYGRKHHNGCQKSQCRKDVLEKYVIDNIIEQMSKPAILNFIADKLVEIQDRKLKDNPEITILTKEIRQTENAINNIMDAIEQGGSSTKIMNRMRELENKLEDLKKQQVVEQAKADFKLTRDEIIQFYKSGLEKEPLRLIDHFIKEIVLFDDRMIIYYNTPTNINLDESQGFSFYTQNIQIPIIRDKRHYIEEEFRIVMQM